MNKEFRYSLLLVVALFGLLRGSSATSPNDDEEVLFNQVFREEGTVAPAEMPALLIRLQAALSESGDDSERPLLVELLLGAKESSGDQCKRNTNIDLQVLTYRAITEANSSGPKVNRSKSNVVSYLNQCIKERFEFCAGLLRASIKAAAFGLAPYEKTLVTLRDTAMAGKYTTEPKIVKGIIETYGNEDKKITSKRLAAIKETLLGICNEVNDQLKGALHVHPNFLEGANKLTKQLMDIGRICLAITKDPEGIFERVKKEYYPVEQKDIE